MGSHFCFNINILHFCNLFHLRVSKNSMDINELSLTAVLREKVMI